MRGRPLPITKNLPLNATLPFLWGKTGYETRLQQAFKPLPQYLEIVSMFVCADGPSLDEVLVDAHKTDNVTAGDIINRFNVATHHQHCPVCYVWEVM